MLLRRLDHVESKRDRNNLEGVPKHVESKMRAAIAVFCVFLGCCTNVVFLELLVKDDPGSGNLITFSQFLFISVEGFLFTSKCGTVKPNIGIKDYFILFSSLVNGVPNAPATSFIFEGKRSRKNA
ncbi:UDP-xylose and UDP-N-acetylglucosamine transporter-like protein [Ooceraea biroi]|uniref:UDP-xylose and UDP-N-acetylglucosamine transporter-like protein n=1 Tax=Ooceraea biroi TaxID=2015173 RepID=A0A026VXS7_OOCBI|nr:UDP-xylose and UDP-N-acetylglucosamine transporter-like protein [Ooceraea biroi]